MTRAQEKVASFLSGLLGDDSRECKALCMANAATLLEIIGHYSGSRVTLAEIEAGRSEKGGYNKEQLAEWGVPWPPPKGWKEALLAGQTMEEAGLHSAAPSPIRPNTSAHELLRKVVLAVIEKGHASDFYEFPDVLEYFGAQLPPEHDR